MSKNKFNGYLYDVQQLGLDTVRYEGGEFVCKCINPHHIDSHPSAYFNPYSGLFFCHSCGFAANVKQIAELTGGRIYKIQSNNLLNQYSDLDGDWHKYLTGKIAINNQYLVSRNIPNELIEKYEIQEFSNGVSFPIKNIFNEVVGCLIRYNTNKKKYRYMQYGEKTVWPKQEWNDFDNNKKIYVTEGIFGALNAIKNGYQAFTIFGANVIPREYQLGKSNLVGLFDNDLAGHLASINLLNFNPSALVHIPGCESDELTKEQWIDIDSGNNLTNDIQQVYNLINNSKIIKHNLLRSKSIKHVQRHKITIQKNRFSKYKK